MKLIESDVVVTYEEGGSIDFLANKFNRHPSSIHRLLKRNGVKTRGIGVYDRSHLTSKLKPVEADIIAAYESGEIVESLALKYECEPSSIHRLLRRKDIEARGIGVYDRSHLISNSPLSVFQRQLIDGLLLSDGTVYNRRVYLSGDDNWNIKVNGIRV